jgi:HEAT repeat protein
VLLKQADYGAICGQADRTKRVLSGLLGLTYDSDDLIGWRAVKALGLASAQVAEVDLEFVRGILRRLLWSLNDESGSIGWRAPQAMGAIIAPRPRPLAEFIPIVVSLFDLDEAHFYPGVLWAIGHMAEHDAECIRFALPHVLKHLADADAQTRGMAAWCLGRLGCVEASRTLDALCSDHAPVTIFVHDELGECAVSELAQEARQRLAQHSIH